MQYVECIHLEQHMEKQYLKVYLACETRRRKTSPLDYNLSADNQKSMVKV